MRRVARGTEPPPAALGARDKDGKNELERARAHISDPTMTKSFEFKAYKDEEVKRRLHELFHGKCAYCETYYSASAPVDVEHYRPKNAVYEDKEHSGYWWIAMAWDNLLPSCIDCNRKRKQEVRVVSASLTVLRDGAKAVNSAQSGKKDSFPLRLGATRLQAELVDYAGEQALLLNPCEDDPAAHLDFVVADTPTCSLVVPRGDDGQRERGATSIQVYGLNRLGLVQDRTRLLRRLEFLGELTVELGVLIDDLGTPAVAEALDGVTAATAPAILRRLRTLLDRTAAEMKAMTEPDQPYSAMAKAWLDAFMVRLDGRP
ncbi:HNH endonuclease [Azospirillum sp. 412522]|nr:hypothetical protein [Azospirillum sp. 412522]MBY6265581.1 HNH endonuclease [Azospirillum sp. 412522]